MAKGNSGLAEKKIAQYEKIGKRWTKGDKDRIYINKIDGKKEVDGIPVRNYFNRYQWDNLDVYYDVKMDELVVSTGTAEAKDVIRRVVKKMLDKA